MKENFDKAFEVMLRKEGGYSNNPLDPGGRTNLGVTQRSWESFIGRSVTEAEMRALTPAVVKPFYKKMYWDKIWGDRLPSGVDLAAFDFAVNSGASRSVRTMQDIAGAVADGVMGPKTLAAINNVPPHEMIEAISMDRLNFLKRLPTWPIFGRGWESRVATVDKTALSMVA